MRQNPSESARVLIEPLTTTSLVRSKEPKTMGTCVEKCRQICVSLSTLLGDSSGGNEGRLWGRVIQFSRDRSTSTRIDSGTMLRCGAMQHRRQRSSTPPQSTPEVLTSTPGTMAQVLRYSYRSAALPPAQILQMLQVSPHFPSNHGCTGIHTPDPSQIPSRPTLPGKEFALYRAQRSL